MILSLGQLNETGIRKKCWLIMSPRLMAISLRCERPSQCPKPCKHRAIFTERSPLIIRRSDQGNLREENRLSFVDWFTVCGISLRSNRWTSSRMTKHHKSCTPLIQGGSISQQDIVWIFCCYLENYMFRIGRSGWTKRLVVRWWSCLCCIILCLGHQTQRKLFC